MPDTKLVPALPWGAPDPIWAAPSPHTPSSPQPWELPAAALKGNRLHLPREKDPDHRVENFWIHVV